MKNTIRFFGTYSRALGISAVFIGALSASAAMAQSGQVEVHEAHVYKGTCQDLGEKVADLTSVDFLTGEQVGHESATIVKNSRTLLNMPLMSIVDGKHSITIHPAGDTSGAQIACGEVGGMVEESMGQQQVQFGLDEVEASGAAGYIWMGSIGEKTEVVITLVE